MIREKVGNLKGYLSFVIVFVAFFSILLILNYSLPESDRSLQIAIEKTNQQDLNVKELVVEATRRGIDQGLVKSAADAQKDILHIRETVAESVHQNLVQLAYYEDDDFETVVWCGDVGSSDLNALRKKSVVDGKALLCDQCKPISDQACRDFIEVSPTFSVHFRHSSQLLNNAGIVGISTYYKKYNISSVSYLPASLEVSP